MNTDILKLENISFSYPGRPVLHEISLNLAKGDFLGILGPNGSGKTTLLRLMAGALKPQEGRVELLGRSLQNYRPRERAREIAVVPQEFDIVFPFKCSEVVLMGRWPYLKPMAWESLEDLKIAQEAMEATDCRQFSERLVTELSGGERERVLIARALAQRPSLLLLDEPTTHLDLQHQLRTYELLLKLNREWGLTLVVVLHDLNFASLACQRVLLLKEGRMIKDGTPLEVMEEKTLREVFEVPVRRERDPETGRPFFLPRVNS